MDVSKAKRQKVTTACDPCRSRKVKCDGHQPVCGPCEKRPRSETACTWATDSSRVSYASTEYIRQLEDRVRLLEGRNTQSQSIPSSNGRSIDGTSQESITRTTGRHVAASSTSLDPTTWQSSFSWVGSSFNSSPDTSVDSRPSASAPAIVPHLFHTIPETLESTDSILISNNHAVQDFVGCLIGRSFMQEVEKAIIEKLGGISQAALSGLGQSHKNPFSIPPSYDSRQKDLGYPLPAREKADSLLSSYWNYVHVLYPFLDKSQTEEEFDKIWKQEISITGQKSFLCLLNSIFAISSRHVRLAGPDHEHLAATFCLRAQEFLDIESCSIRSVQSYLLLALYFQSIDDPRKCWMFVGLAIRTAQILELHRIERSEREPDSRTRDLLRKVWHGCVLMDREVSMIYGQPCMIDPKTAAAIPLPTIEEETFKLGHVQSHTTEARQTHAADFYTHCLGLYDILYDVLLHLYSSKSPRQSENGGFYSEHFSPFQANTLIVELEERLSKWESRIPNYYKTGSKSVYSSINGLLVRRRVILRQRHLHVHLLLLRPMLQSFITSEFRNKGEPLPVGSLLSHRVSLQCAIVCVKIAQEAIDTVYVNEGTSSNEMRDLSAWWYNAIFLYTSATVLIAASLSSSVVAEISQDSIYDSFHKAVAVLRQYETFNTSILRLTTALHILSSTIPKNYSRIKQAWQRNESNNDEPMSEDANTAATFQYWCPLRPNRRQASPSDEPKAHSHSKSNHQAPSPSLSNLDLVFDPDDFTWLIKIPFYT